MIDAEPNTYLLDHNPAKLLPYEKRLAPEDPEAVDAGRHFMRNSVIDPSDAKV